MQFIQWISEPWHWAVSGTGLAVVMFLMLWYGNRFGVSSNLRTLCTLCGIGRDIDFFKFDWKEYSWNLLFIIGAVIGGFIAANVLPTSEPVQISTETQSWLLGLEIHTPGNMEEGNGFVPAEMYDLTSDFGIKKFLLLVLTGLLVGFGTRYANGCTSGHAISGLSNLQLPSLIAVVGFFIGGLTMTWLLLPSIIHWLNL